MIIRKYNKKYKAAINKPSSVWFIWFYRDGCPFCDSVHSDWDKLEAYVRKNKLKINIAKIEGKFINEDMLGFNPNISYVPTFMIRKINDKGKAINTIKNTRDLEEFKKIVSKYS